MQSIAMTSNSARDPFTAIILLHVHDAADIRLVVTIPLFMSHTQLVYLYIYTHNLCVCKLHTYITEYIHVYLLYTYS